MPPQPEPQRSEEWRAKQGASIKASWTPERKARQAEMMRARRAAMLADPNRKPSKAELARRKKAEREAAQARTAERKEALQASIVERGGVIKTPEQRQQSKQEYLASRAARTREPEYHFAPWPQTLDALRSGCGQYGDLILSHAVATAARSWACDAIDEHGHSRRGNATANPSTIIRTALDLHLCQLWTDAGASGHWTEYGNPALRDLSASSRQEAMQVVEETIAEWEAAGRPGLDHPALFVAYRYLCGHVWTGGLEPFPGCPETPALYADFRKEPNDPNTPAARQAECCAVPNHSPRA